MNFDKAEVLRTDRTTDDVVLRLSYRPEDGRYYIDSLWRWYGRFNPAALPNTKQARRCLMLAEIALDLCACEPICRTAEICKLVAAEGKRQQYWLFGDNPRAEENSIIGAVERRLAGLRPKNIGKGVEEWVASGAA